MSSCAGFSLSAPVPVLELLPSHQCHPRAVTQNGGCASENTTLDGGFGVPPRSVILQAVPFLIWLHEVGWDVGSVRPGVWGDVEQGCSWLLLGSEEVRGGEHGLLIQPSGGDGLIHQGHRHNDL